MLQSRLLSTRDTLDVLQRTHQEELLSITTERDRMKRELQQYVYVVESAELELDDMRDAVMKLIEEGVNRRFRSCDSTWTHQPLLHSEDFEWL